jgi:hypothetical protein
VGFPFALEVALLGGDSFLAAKQGRNARECSCPLPHRQTAAPQP